MTAEVLMATPCTKSLGCESGGRKQYICQRLKLEGETENICVCTKERKGDTAKVLMATTCTNSLGGESGEQKHEGCDVM